ncbi:hypothetical protein CSO01_09930 [Cellulomonas soli]|uniref:Uncharacterized protein n=1 Tax=Cellulomonas soli TaxID=931535 RepID=A0A512PAQ5_9CELL|nr:hypothetical protein [Cellulomonas soli]GEP68278.1 hypothetical protein CSO01_09930 [Cellulomonas soli]
MLTTGTGAVIKFQLVDTVGRPPWPTALEPILQRYPDAPPATLRVPTPGAAALLYRPVVPTPYSACSGVKPS